MKVLVGSVAVLAVLLVGLWSMSRDVHSPRVGSLEERDKQQDTPFEPSPANDLLSPPNQRSMQASQPADAPQGESRREELSSKATQEDYVLAGTVALLDANQKSQPTRRGTLRLRVKPPAGIESLPGDNVCFLPFENGRFRAHFKRGADGNYRLQNSQSLLLGYFMGSWIEDAKLSVLGGIVEDAHGSIRVVRVTGPLAWGNEDVHIVLQEQRPFEVHVKDSRTKLPIEKVCLIRAPRDAYPGQIPRLNDVTARVAWEEPSPIQLPLLRLREQFGREVFRSDREWSWFVGAPDYGWQLVEFATEENSQVTVFLQPAGSLEVSLAGEVSSAPPSTEIRLYREGEERALASFPIDSPDPIRFSPLVESMYSVRAETGHTWDQPTVFAKAEASVQAGYSKTLELVLQALPKLEHSKLSGSIDLPAAWELDKFRLVLDLHDAPLDGTTGHRVLHSADMERLRGGETYLFECEDLQVGTYTLQVAPTGYRREFEIREAGLSGFRLRVPPPATLEVTPRHYDTGEPVPVAFLRWQWGPNGGEATQGSKRVRREPDQEAFRFRVPQGSILLACNSDRYGSGSESREIHGDVTLDLLVRPED